jgi:hypothetical protein
MFATDASARPNSDRCALRAPGRLLKVLTLEDEWLNADIIAMIVEDYGITAVGISNTIAADWASNAAKSAELGRDILDRATWSA